MKLTTLPCLHKRKRPGNAHWGSISLNPAQRGKFLIIQKGRTILIILSSAWARGVGANAFLTLPASLGLHFTQSRTAGVQFRPPAPAVFLLNIAGASSFWEKTFYLFIPSYLAKSA
ncbi:hypothetical protein LJC27_07330 [Christensenellaceae bacterium OttesenSCG-928-M15]|nr:hypothetical protein [Christensenellaceae bacterium OttesenSCG-928-M15]